MTDVTKPSNPNYKWWVVAMLWCMSFFNYADRQALSAILPLLNGAVAIEQTAGAPDRLVVTAIPKQTLKSDVLARLQKITTEGTVPAIAAVADESAPDPKKPTEEKLRLVMTLKPGNDPVAVRNQVYENAGMTMWLDKAEQGALSTAFAWCYGLAAPFAGLLVDRMSRKRVVLWGLQLWSLICLGTGFARNFFQLFLFRAAEGLGEAAYFPASMSLISDYHGKDTRSRAMSLHQTSVYVGTILGSVFAAWIGSRYGWKWSFIVFGALGMGLGFILRAHLVEPTRGQSEVATEAAVSARLTLADINPSLLLAYGAFCGANFVAGVLLVWLPSFFVERFGVNLAVGALSATAPIQIASMVAAPLGGWLADGFAKRFPAGRMGVQMLGVLLAAPCVYLFATTHTYVVALGALFAWGAFKGIYDANIFATAYDVVRPGARGAAAGVMNMVGWALGAAPAAWITGAYADRSGGQLGPAIAMSAFAYVVAGVLLLLGVLFFVKRDRARMLTRIAAETAA